MFEGITNSLGRVFDRLRGQKRLGEEQIREAMREVRVALLEADVAQGVARDFIDRVSEAALGAEVIKSVQPGEMVIKIVHDHLLALLGGERSGLVFAPAPPTVLMLCGLQGSGKTTTAGKLALRLIGEGHKPLLVAADVQRPAAVEQLKILGQQVGAPVYAEPGGDPVAICRRAREVAELHAADLILLDTAGRLHVDEALMEELSEIVAAARPDEILLVLDAMTGQDAVQSAAAFGRRLSLTGAILTKLDGDARGGAALSLRAATGVPIKFAGVGEKLEALEEFHPDRMAGRILGMGDIVSLVERAQAHVDEEEQLRMQERLLKNAFTLDDFQKQLAQIRKMGSIKDLLEMIPGLGRQLQGIDIDESEFRRIEAMIQSMTREERGHPELLGSSRKERIAQGSGQSLANLDGLLKQFAKMKKMIGQMSRGGMLGRLLGGAGPSLALDGGDEETELPAGFAGLGGGGFSALGPGAFAPRDGAKVRKDKKKERKKEKQNRKKKRRR